MITKNLCLSLMIGCWLLFFSSSQAQSNNSLGPFEKSATNPILQKNISNGGIVSGTGHNSLLRDKEGKLWCVYHARTTKTGSQRLVFLDELKILPNGQLVVDGPTVKP